LALSCIGAPNCEKNGVDDGVFQATAKAGRLLKLSDAAYFRCELQPQNRPTRQAFATNDR
jgi:hypothetical protein